jgi:glycosyltransferase involved in cell wall biosynthesis
MRITIVIGPFFPVPPVLGGAVEKVHLLLAGAYRKAGHDVTIVSREFSNFPEEEVVEGIRHLRIPSFDRSSSRAINLALDFRYALRVARRLPKSDITVTNSFFLPLLLGRQTAGKIYVHVARYPKHQMVFYWRADRLQAISRAVALEIGRQAPKLTKKVVTIGYPVSDDYFKSNSSEQRKRVILFVGRVAREKGVHLLIEAFNAIWRRTDLVNNRDWQLRIVGPHDIALGGDGSGYLSELVELARPLGSSCVFAGPIFGEEALIKEYRAASVFVYPSLAETGEAFGLAPLEAMAAGCAVIVSNLRCFDDFIEDGISALKFEHRSENPAGNLRMKLESLIEKPILIDEIAKGGHRAARQFQSTTIAGMMLNDFESVAAGGRNSTAHLR